MQLAVGLAKAATQANPNKDGCSVSLAATIHSLNHVDKRQDNLPRWTVIHDKPYAKLFTA
jgi:hypothetical protein